MIVPSMTVQEIHKEVFEDIRNLNNKIENLKIEFGKLVLKRSRYPYSKSFDCRTREMKNLFIIEFTVLKRSDWDKPILGIYGIYTRPEGKYAVSLTLEKNLVSIYPPHFFKRYRERIFKDELISNDEIIRHYFKNDWGFMGSVVNEKFESIYHCFENDHTDDKISFVAATSQGYCFGERQGDVNIVKTIISEDMLYENQKDTFASLKLVFNDANKERYGRSV